MCSACGVLWGEIYVRWELRRVCIYAFCLQFYSSGTGVLWLSPGWWTWSRHLAAVLPLIIAWWRGIVLSTLNEFPIEARQPAGELGTHFLVASGSSECGPGPSLSEWIILLFIEPRCIITQNGSIYFLTWFAAVAGGSRGSAGNNISKLIYFHETHTWFRVSLSSRDKYASNEAANTHFQFNFSKQRAGVSLRCRFVGFGFRLKICFVFLYWWNVCSIDVATSIASNALTHTTSVSDRLVRIEHSIKLRFRWKWHRKPHNMQHWESTAMSICGRQVRI